MWFLISTLLKCKRQIESSLLSSYIDGDSLPNVQIYSLLLQVFKKSINQLLLAKVLQQEHRFDKYCILLILMSLLLAMKWHSQFQIDLCNLL